MVKALDRFCLGREGDVLVIIPAFNEQGAIWQVVSGVKGVLPLADVLVIDDGSKDDTRPEAQRAGAMVIRHPINLGIGATVQTGLKFAWQQGYQTVVRLDGDGQHNPLEIPTLLGPLQNAQADAIFGSRFLSKKVTWHIPFGRRLGISLFAHTVSWLTGRVATDTTSGFWALNRPAVQTLATYLPQDYPEVEGRIILHKAGLRALETPVTMNQRTTGLSSINHWRSIYYAFKVTLAVLITTLKEIPPFEKSDQPRTANSQRK